MKKLRAALKKCIEFFIVFSPKIDEKSNPKVGKTLFARKIDEKSSPGAAFGANDRFLLDFGVPEGTDFLVWGTILTADPPPQNRTLTVNPCFQPPSFGILGFPRKRIRPYRDFDIFLVFSTLAHAFLGAHYLSLARLLFGFGMALSRLWPGFCVASARI